MTNYGKIVVGDGRNALTPTVYIGGITGFSANGKYEHVYNYNDLQACSTDTYTIDADQYQNIKDITYYIGGILGYARNIDIKKFCNYADIYIYIREFVFFFWYIRMRQIRAVLSPSAMM